MFRYLWMEPLQPGGLPGVPRVGLEENAVHAQSAPTPDVHTIAHVAYHGISSDGGARSRLAGGSASQCDPDQRRQPREGRVGLLRQPVHRDAECRPAVPRGHAFRELPHLRALHVFAIGADDGSVSCAERSAGYGGRVGVHARGPDHHGPRLLPRRVSDGDVRQVAHGRYAPVAAGGPRVRGGGDDPQRQHARAGGGHTRLQRLPPGPRQHTGSGTTERGKSTRASARTSGSGS